MTRSESRRFKMDLLSRQPGLRLVTGSETGHDAAVPYVHYFEGMLSLGPYRVPTRAGTCSGSYKTYPSDGQVPDGSLLPPALVGAGLSRLRCGAVVLGRLQQQAAQAVGPQGSIERALWNPAHVHVRRGVVGAQRAVSWRVIARPLPSPGPRATRRCSPIGGLRQTTRSKSRALPTALRSP